MRLAAAIAATALVPSALAQNGAPPAVAQPPIARIVEVRLALSGSAAERLSELRVRRLLEIELEENAVLAPGVGGPLGDYVAYVWVDHLSPAQILIEVRVRDRLVARREISVGGLAGDVAARLVAIAVSELVRTQMQPIRQPPKRPAAPRRPTPEELELASRAAPALFLDASASAAFLPANGSLFAGPSLSLGFRLLGASESLFARWLTGESGAGAARWFEIGASAQARLWQGPSLRLALGGAAALASLHVGGARVLDGVPGAHDVWSARAGAVIGVETRVGRTTWLAFALEPGAILRPIRHDGERGPRAFEGLWLGLDAGLQFDWVERSPLAN